MEYKGYLKVKGETQRVTEKFSKRTFVLTDNAASYPQNIEFQLTQKNCDILNNFNVGDELMVTFNLKGREWKNQSGEVKYFNTLDSFRIKEESEGNFENNNVRQVQPHQQMDDLPF